MSARTHIALALKAEAVLALQLITRHRAPRLAALLVVVALLPAGFGADGGLHALLLASGTLAAVCASRPLAPGAALLSASAAGAAPWLPVLGRFLGALAVVVPAAAVATAALVQPEAPAAFTRALRFTLAYAAAVTALAMGLTPFAGATLTALAALLIVWLGPAAVPDAPLARPLGLVQSLLPAPGRVVRWHASGSPLDALWHVAWITGGLALATLGLARGRRGVMERRALR